MEAAHEEVQEGELDIIVDDVTRATGKISFSSFLLVILKPRIPCCWRRLNKMIRKLSFVLIFNFFLFELGEGIRLSISCDRSDGNTKR